MVQSDDLRRAFVARLRAAMTHSGYQEWGMGARLAKIASATPKAASKWLNAEAMPSRAKMLAIADALGVRAEWLEYGEGEMLPSIEGAPGAASGSTSSVEGGNTNQTVAHHADMLAAIASPQSRDVLTRIARAAEDGLLTEADIALLGQIASRIAQREAQPLEGANQKIFRKIRDAVKTPDRG